MASAIQLIVQIARFHDGSRRLTHISEVTGLTDEGNYQVQDLYRFVPASHNGASQVSGDFEWTGVQPTFSAAPYFDGLAEQISLTRSLWTEQEVTPGN